MIGLASTLSVLLLATGGLTEAVAKRSSASVISEPSFLGWKPTPCPHGRRCKPDELTKYLSPGAEIILPSNKELFKNLTTRYSEVDKPGIDVVVRVATERDIVQTMNFAKKHNRPYLAANTGHGWPIMTQTQHGILIRIDKLNKVTVRDDGTFTIAAGVRNYQLIAALDAKGREASHGVCDCAGSMGLTLGGGHGRKQGLYGLMADNLISARLIVASGKIITVSNDTNPSLFWALRGAGHNFGIVAEATFHSHPQTNGGLHFNSDMIYNASAIEPLFTAINSFKLPPQANIFVFYAVDPASGTPIAIFNFVYSGLEKAGKAMVDRHFGDIPAMSRKDSMIPYGQLNRIGASGFFETACQEGRRRAGHNVGIKSYDPKLQVVLFEKFSKTIKDYPEASGSAVLFESYALEKFQEIDHDSTAYPNRDVNIIVLWAGNYASPALDDVMNRQGREFIALMQKSTGYSQPRVYVNYAHGDEDPKTYYGYESWRLNRLNGLKKQYDPQCRFGGYMPLPYCTGRSH